METRTTAKVIRDLDISTDIKRGGPIESSLERGLRETKEMGLKLDATLNFKKGNSTGESAVEPPAVIRD